MQVGEQWRLQSSQERLLLNLISVNLLVAKTLLTPPKIWRTVPPKLNLVDVASRGVNLRELLQTTDWLTGPEWLKANPMQWPVDRRDVDASSYEEITRFVLANIADRQKAVHPSYFSNIYRLLCFMVRLRRWIRHHLNRTPAIPVLDPLTPAELSVALEACIRLSQRPAFSMEIDFLNSTQQREKPEPLPGKGPLRSLNSFVCPVGIFRVGGGLEHFALPYNQKHPPILDGSCHLAKLIISWANTRALHGGSLHVLLRATQRAWLIGGKRHKRRFIQRCVICARIRVAPLGQLMASLPPARVLKPVRAFAKTGLDYAGPFHFLPTTGRGMSTTKAYVAVFVCMASKATHLEFAGDLTFKSLKAALIRFCGLRGRPAEIWSDNATNFHRADVELREALNQKALKWDDTRITWHKRASHEGSFRRLPRTSVGSGKRLSARSKLILKG